jgi:hypothetical protein
MRLGIGLDAADVTFATIFGNVLAHASVFRVWALADAALGTQLPHTVLMFIH